jgi:DNA-binding HxlR family transcriptional regulator
MIRKSGNRFSKKIMLKQRDEIMMRFYLIASRSNRAAMRQKDYGCDPGCPVEVTLNLIDGKWKGVILFHLQTGTCRFGELRRRMPRITQRMLTKQLRALEEDGLITRKIFPEVPPRVEYTLSEMGERLRPVIDVLNAWGEAYHAQRGAAVPGHATAVASGL